MEEIIDIVKKYLLYDVIVADYSKVKSVPYSVKDESEVYRRHIFQRIKFLKDKSNITLVEKQEIEELDRCIKLINKREKELFDSDIDY